MNNNYRLVLDTNVFLVSILPHHKYWWVFEGIIYQRYTLLVSNEILMEYLEKCIQKYGDSLSNERLEFLLEFSNVELITPYYHWELIQNDPDDNKFVDCAVAGQADFLVTHDKHFNILKDIPFPKVEAIRLDELKKVLGA
ncbi:MAG: putative toxin-antitoxin system toxin component, PIN family [Lewinellaceae bacterium]|nr:putative toxin-antitoxin system toxin component, PIN family [Phaeodactylibacter sp.]MCB9037925.1 putative toxin-antitoxin system toxin component, PIN family [Lewinellaceae bacterium]